MPLIQKTIALDLDGVFADFFPFAQREFGKDYRKANPARFWEWASSVPNLYANLEPIPGSRALFEMLSAQGHNLYVLTALPRPTGFLSSAAQDKREWVTRHLDASLRVETVVGGENKARFSGPGHILIDDTQRNILAWESAGGTGILHISTESTIAKCRDFGLLPPKARSHQP